MAIHFILGGVRSGKSAFAQKLALTKERVLYVATANAQDEGMSDRIRRHRQERPNHWRTLEAYRDFRNHKSSFEEADFVIVDCLTLMVSRLFFEIDSRVEHFEWPLETQRELERHVFSQVEELLEALGETPCAIVSNEVGLGVVPESWLGNYFRDISGRINQLLAERALQVSFLLAGIPVRVKGED